MPRATRRAISSTMSVVFPVPDQPVIATACISRVYADEFMLQDELERNWMSYCAIRAYDERSNMTRFT